MKIIEYINCNKVLIEFQDAHKYTVYSRYSQFKEGRIRNPYDRIAFNKGYFGEGKYKSTINNKLTKQYITWRHMLQRCYDPKRLKQCPTYIDCDVCDEWLNYQNFGEWYDENYYQVGDEMMSLDKDILHKHNKIYSPDNCIFVPQKINTLFIKKDANRGNLPIGVVSNGSKKKEKYIALCSDGYCNQEQIGVFTTKYEALNAYKIHKKNIIIKTVEGYKDKIPENTYNKLHNAVLNYEVEDDD